LRRGRAQANFVAALPIVGTQFSLKGFRIDQRSPFVRVPWYARGKQEKIIGLRPSSFWASAILLWFPTGEIPSIFNFEATHDQLTERTVEKWWSVRDAVKYAIDNPKVGLSPWMLVKTQQFAPTQLLEARSRILQQDREDALRS
jgi:hypothetical protein